MIKATRKNRFLILGGKETTWVPKVTRGTMVGHPWKQISITRKGIMQRWLDLPTFPNEGENLQEKTKKKSNANITKGRGSYILVSEKYEG